MADLDWTAEQVQTLALLWSDVSNTAAVIGALMDITRNAVLGKANRIGLPPRARGGNRTPREFREPRAPRIRKAVVRIAAPRPPAPVALPEPSGAHRCDLMGLVNSSCRWPVSDDAPYFFCGEPEADMIGRIPYCPYHSLMARGSKSAPRVGFAAQAAA